MRHTNDNKHIFLALRLFFSLVDTFRLCQGVFELFICLLTRSFARRRVSVPAISLSRNSLRLFFFCFLDSSKFVVFRSDIILVHSIDLSRAHSFVHSLLFPYISTKCILLHRMFDVVIREQRTNNHKQWPLIFRCSLIHWKNPLGKSLCFFSRLLALRTNKKYYYIFCSRFGFSFPSTCCFRSMRCVDFPLRSSFMQDMKCRFVPFYVRF